MKIAILGRQNPREFRINMKAALEAAGENRSAFFWYTDSHWSGSYRRSPMILPILQEV